MARAVRTEVTVLASRRYPGRAYCYRVEEGDTPDRYFVVDGDLHEERRRWPPPEDPDDHLVVGVLSWVPGFDEESTYRCQWKVAGALPGEAIAPPRGLRRNGVSCKSRELPVQLRSSRTVDRSDAPTRQLTGGVFERRTRSSVRGGRRVTTSPAAPLVTAMNRRGGPFQELGPVLRALRRERDLTVETLQARSGISEQALQAFEAAEGLPTLQELGAILDTLGVGGWELGWRLDHAQRVTRGAVQPPEEFRWLVEDLTQSVAAALWFRSMPEGGESDLPEELLAQASEAGKGMVEVLWGLFEPVLVLEAGGEESS